ncbi:MAG: response regulator transcription factor [Alphaproteobacteria bacterium]|nr:response regulator transcription factor [Alphaproteobacteria bacterium]
MSVSPVRLRVAVAASDDASQSRLAAFVAECGHELVELSAAPDAILSDGAADGVAPASAVAVGGLDEEFAGRLPADAGTAQIDAALRAVAAGLTVRAPDPQGGNFGELAEEPPVPLTAREIEVLSALGSGLSNKAAARRLGISPHTVKFHIESLFRKLGASTRAEAVAKGLKRQIVEF